MDMINTYSIEVEAPPCLVFTWIERTDRVMEWVPHIVTNQDLVVTPERVGDKFRQVFVENGRRTELVGTITAYQVNELLKCELTSEQFDLTVAYHLKELGKQRTMLKHSSETRYKGMAKLNHAFSGEQLASEPNSQLKESFGRLKRLVENESRQAHG